MSKNRRVLTSTRIFQSKKSLNIWRTNYITTITENIFFTHSYTRWADQPTFRNSGWQVLSGKRFFKLLLSAEIWQRHNKFARIIYSGTLDYLSSMLHLHSYRDSVFTKTGWGPIFEDEKKERKKNFPLRVVCYGWPKDQIKKVDKPVQWGTKGLQQRKLLWMYIFRFN